MTRSEIAQRRDQLLAELRTLGLVPGASTPEPVDVNGYCYLSLFDAGSRDLARTRLGAWPVTDDVCAALVGHHRLPGNDGDRFALWFGNPLSVARSDKNLCLAHVAPAGESLLKWRDVLPLLPRGARLGGDVTRDPASVPRNVAELSHIPAQIYDPLVRRFILPAGFLRTAASAPTARTFHADVFAARCREWAAFFPTVRFTSVKAVLVPLAAAGGYHVSLWHAWYPGNVAAPTTEDEFVANPSACLVALRPEEPGNAAPNYEVSAAANYDVSFQAKPAPIYGGTARFAARFNAVALSGTTYTADVGLYQVLIEVLASAHPV